MSLVARSLQAQRWTVAGMLALTAVVFWRPAFTVFSLPKATVVLVAVVGLVAGSGLRAAATRRAFVPSGPPLWAAAGFALALGLATLTSPNPLGSAAGQGGRFTGLVMYGAYLALFAYAARLYRHHSPAHLVQALAVAAVGVVGYGYLQLLGLDPFGWGFREHGPPMFSTLGNPNFFAAWVGIVGVLCVAGALVRALARPWRVLCAGAGVSCALAAAVSQSLQGPAAFAAGGLVLGLVALWSAGGTLRRWRVHLAGGLAAAAVLGLALVVAGAGPLAAVRDAAAASYASRAGKWAAAWAMFADRPLLGQGLDRYAEAYWTYRPVREAAAHGIARNVDAAHSVPLDMLASGGLVLGLAYLGLLATVVWSVAVGLRRVDGDRRVLLAGFAGAWFAYQVQSAVSIDVPGVAVLGWVCAGVAVALAGTAPLREVGVRAGTAPARPPRASLAGVGVVGVAAVTLALWPLGADLAAGAARDAAADGRDDDALAGWDRAARMAPWDARYAAERAHALAARGDLAATLAAYEVAWDREHSLFRALTPARVAARAGALADAERWYARALDVDGAKTPAVLSEAGELRLAAGDGPGAAAVYRRAAALYPGEEEWAVGLRRALELGS